VAKHGGGNLANLVDLGGVLTLETVEQRHDRASNRLFMKVRVKNVTKDTVRLDVVKIRALSFNSDVAVVTAGNADNGLIGPGAVWDLTSTLPATGLLPDSAGTVKELVFQFTEIRPFRQGSKNRFRVLSMNGKLLGQRKPKP
jgi:hypothetical protein